MWINPSSFIFKKTPVRLRIDNIHQETGKQSCLFLANIPDFWEAQIWVEPSGHWNTVACLLCNLQYSVLWPTLKTLQHYGHCTELKPNQHDIDSKCKVSEILSNCKNMYSKFATSCSIHCASVLLCTKRLSGQCICWDLAGGGLQDEVKEDSIQDQAKEEQQSKEAEADMLLPQQLFYVLYSVTLVLLHVG